MATDNDRLKEMQVQLDNWDIEIEKLKAQAETETADPEIQLKYYKLIEILRSRQEEVRGKLEKLKLAEDDDWKDLKQGIGSSWKNIKTTLSDTGKAFKKGLEENKRDKK
jgi:hypothetical protein